MLLRSKLAGLFIALVTSATLLLSGCSSSSPHDININTDVGVGFVPPDGGPSTTAYDAAVDAGSAVETAVDTANTVDGGVSVDGEGLVDAAIDGAS